MPLLVVLPAAPSIKYIYIDFITYNVYYTCSYQVGIDISVDYRSLWRAGTLESLTVHNTLCRCIHIKYQIRIILRPNLTGYLQGRGAASSFPLNKNRDSPTLPRSTHMRGGPAVLRGWEYAQ